MSTRLGDNKKQNDLHARYIIIAIEIYPKHAASDLLAVICASLDYSAGIN